MCHRCVFLKVLYGKVREDVRKIISTLCRYKGVEIIAGAVCTNHVYLSIVIPSKIGISSFMVYLKGESTMMLHGSHSELRSK